ncbi:Uu.00g072970.m01.CDS01 [Anthostomella pinea]|uniref:Uu.00g072970.m01.CDS01 n=1 Tax=Anthostomella pinea TaxID=933095 RepID=A0AAI8YLI0_9PEZI|nr:Uu.00g072970.m01.CDS01 [Anthostomella pinea]
MGYYNGNGSPNARTIHMDPNRHMEQGMHITENSVYLALSRRLWAYVFERPHDEVSASTSGVAAAVTRSAFPIPNPTPKTLSKA